MPTIPLFSPPAVPDAWHAVRAPGGLEWWRFDAESETGETRVVVDLLEGDPFDVEHRKQYRRYRGRPTANAPPLPANFPRASVAIYHEGRTSFAEIDHPLAADVSALRIDAGPDVRVVDDGGVNRVIAGRGETRVDLAFTPTWPAATEIELAPQMRWILAAPRCEVVGTITTAGRSLPFKGVGFHEHFVSTKPLAEIGLGTDWFRARVLLPDAVWMVHVSSLFNGDVAAIKVVRADAGGVTVVPIEKASMQIKSAWSGACYPVSMTLSNGLSLTGPMVLKSKGLTRLLYDATINGQQGKALAEVVRSVGW